MLLARLLGLLVDFIGEALTQRLVSDLWPACAVSTKSWAGIREYSFNVLAAMPGCGKTTMAHQIAFANATVEKPALYFTVLGEPAIKMLRYQQQFTFFDESKLGTAIRFVNLSDVLLEQDLSRARGNRQPGHGGPSGHCRGGLLPHRDAPGGGERQRGGDADFHPRAHPVPHQLGSHHLSGRRVCRGGNARRSAVHHRGRAH